MYSKKGFFSLIGLVIAVTIISALILLIMNKVYFTKGPFDNNTTTNPLIENIDSSEYQSILKRSERTARSLNNKFRSQEKILDRW